MTQEIFPEIVSAAQALEQLILKTEAEVSEMRESIAAKETLISGWRDVIKLLLPDTAQGTEGSPIWSPVDNPFYF